MNKLDYKKFYSELGKLLYAVADVDQVISQSEKTALYTMVRNELAPAEKHTDEFDTDTAFYAEIEFDFLDDSIIDSETALQSFLDYIEDHQRIINQPMRDACFRLAEKLAKDYYGKSDKERQLLDKLKNKLQDLEQFR